MPAYIVSTIPENDGSTKHLFTTIYTTSSLRVMLLFSLPSSLLCYATDLPVDWIYVVYTLFFQPLQG